MIEAYDVVTALRDLSAMVRKGYRGTVLILHQGDPPAYEVEFVNDCFKTMDLLTVLAEDICKD